MAHVWVRSTDSWTGGQGQSACAMTAEVAQNDREFRVVIAVPGCDEKHLQVTAAPSVIVVEGSLPPPERLPAEEVVLSEFAGRRMVRVVQLPEEIAPDEVRAHLHNGLLTIVAEKARAVRLRRSAYAARA